MKTYNSYKDSGNEWIGEIPSEWECIRLGMLGSFSSSGIDKKSNDGEIDVRMVNYTDLIQSRRYNPMQTGEKNYMRVTTTLSKLNEHRLEKGDMVLIPSSETHEDLGYASLIDFDEDDIVYSYHIIRYKIKKPLFHYFKKYLINHHSVLNQFSLQSKGTTRKIIGRDVFNNIKVVLPSILEQEQIVTFLDKKTTQIDSIIEKTQKKIELLKEKRLKLIENVLLNPNIKKIKLKHLVNLIKRPIQRKEDKIYTKIGMYNWGRGIFKYPSEMGSDLGDSSFNYLKEGDLLLSGQFSWEGSVSIVEKEENNCISSHRFHILNVKKKELINEYLWSYFTSQEGHFLLNENSPGSAGRNRPLNIENLLREKIPVPEIEAQIEIQKLVIATKKYEKYAKPKIKFLKEFKQSLISSVVTGKIKVTKDMI